MSSLLRFCIVLGLLAPTFAHPAVLENPSSGNFYSGVSVISGWKCEANGPLTVRFYDEDMASLGDSVPLAYLNERLDTAGVCGDTNNGFVSIWNYALLGRGEGIYTAVAYDNGEEFARSTFEVYAYKDSFGDFPDGYEEFMRGAFSSCVAHGFHPDGQRQQFMWNEATQHMEMVDISPASQAWHSVATLNPHPYNDPPECTSFGVALDKATQSEAEEAARQNCEAKAVSGCTYSCESYWNDDYPSSGSTITWEGAACYAVVDCSSHVVSAVVSALGRTQEQAGLRTLAACDSLAENIARNQGTTVLPATATQIVDTGCPQRD